MKSIVSGRTFLACKGKLCEMELWDRKIWLMNNLQEQILNIL